MKKLLIAGAALALITGCNMKTNPLLTESSAPFGAPQFDKIENEHYLPAFETAIAEAKAEIDAIIANEEEPTFEKQSRLWNMPAKPSATWQAYSTT